MILIKTLIFYDIMYAICTLFSYDRPTLVFPGIKSDLLICCTFNPTNLVLSKWACFMPGKTKGGRSYIILSICTRKKFKKFEQHFHIFSKEQEIICFLTTLSLNTSATD